MQELLVILGALVILMLSIGGMTMYRWRTDVLTGPYIRNRDPLLDQADNAQIADAVLHESHQPVFADRVEKGGHICVKNEVHSPALDPDDQRIQRIVLTSLGSEPVAEPEEVFLVDGVQHSSGRSLDDLVLECRNCQRTLFSISLRYVRPA